MKLNSMVLALALGLGASGLCVAESALPGTEDYPEARGRSDTDPSLNATGFDDRPGPPESLGESEPAVSTVDFSESRFEQLDLDQDQSLSQTEAEADPDLAAIFSEVDEDGDNQLSAEEFTEYAPEN